MSKFNLIVPFLVVCGVNLLVAQQKVLEGIILNDEEVEGIHVLNLTSRLNTVTNLTGVFKIRVKEKDTLLISSIKYTPQKIVIDSSSYTSGHLYILLEEMVNELDAVVVGPRLSGILEHDLKSIQTRKEINFDDVGIPGFKGKPEEKIPPVIGGVITPTSINLEALYNHLSGYYKELKLKRQWESENVACATIINFYSASFFMEAYKIPSERLYDFMLFCIETSDLEKVFKAENYSRVLSIFNEKSKIYLQPIVGSNFK